MLKGIFVKLIGMMMVLVLFSACVSSTLMTVNATDPNGRPINNAIVLVDGENIGLTPNATVRVSNFVLNNPELIVSKEGFHTTWTEARREIKPANVILGFFCFGPLFWAFGPRARQNVVLIPISAD